MRTIGRFSIFTAMLVIAACNPKVETNKDQALVDSLLLVNENAWNSGDAQKIANMFTEDALMIVNGVSTWTRDSIYVFANSLTPVLKNFKAYLGPTSVSKDMVQMQKYFTGDIVMESSTLKGKGIAFLIWEKQADKSWKIIMELEDYSLN